MISGAACLLVPLLVPQHVAAYLFALVWIGFLLLLDPLNRRLGLPSFIGDLAEGMPRRFYGFLAGRLDLRLSVGILELLGGREMALHLPDVSALENI